MQDRHKISCVAPEAEGMAGLVPPTIDGEATPLPSAQITPKAA